MVVFWTPFSLISNDYYLSHCAILASETDTEYNSEFVLRRDLVSKYSYVLGDFKPILERQAVYTRTTFECIKTLEYANKTLLCNVYIQRRFPMHTFVEATADRPPKRSLKRRPDRGGSRMRPPFHQTFRSRYQRFSRGSRSAPALPEQLQVMCPSTL